MSIISGVGPMSGINYDQLITGLLAVQQQPITDLQAKETDYNNKISAYGTLSTKLMALQSAANTLRTSTNFYAKTGSSSDSTIVDVSVTSAASAGNYTIAPHSVAGKIQLANFEQVVQTAGVASSTDVINNSGSDQTFQYTYAGTQRALTVTDQTTLEGLRDAINNDSGNPGVTASIIYDGSAYKLAISGNNTGSANTISIDAGTTLNGTGGTTDLSSTAFTTTQAAQDAKVNINGVDITRSTNTISDVIPGVTLTLKKETTGSVTVSVNNDVSTISNNIQAFVSAYNDVISYISGNSTYDTTTNTGGTLYGEFTAGDIPTQLSNIITSPVAGLPSDLNILAQIGVSTNNDGTLSLDTATLNNQLSSNLSGVGKIFTDAAGGIGNQIYDFVNNETDSVDGAITYRTNGLNTSISNINNDISNLQERLNMTEERLRTQFAALETLLGSLQAQSTFLTNQSGIWAKQ